MTRNFLVQAFRFNHRATLKIERAVEEETKSCVSNILTAASNLDPSVVLESDVLEIMQRQLKKLEQNDDQKLKGLYKSSSGKDPNTVAKKKSNEDHSQDGSKKQQKHVQIQNKATDNIIGMDNSAMAGV